MTEDERIARRKRAAERSRRRRAKEDAELGAGLVELRGEHGIGPVIGHVTTTSGASTPVRWRDKPDPPMAS